MKRKIDKAAIKAELKKREISYNQITFLLNERFQTNYCVSSIEKLLSNRNLSNSFEITYFICKILELPIEEIMRF